MYLQLIYPERRNFVNAEVSKIKQMNFSNRIKILINQIIKNNRFNLQIKKKLF